MRSAKLLGALSLVGFGAFSASIAMASDAGWYAGLGAGQSSAKFDWAGLAANAANGTAATTPLSAKHTGNAYKIFGGYDFGNNFAAELSYFNLGKFSYTAGATSGTSKVDGISLDLVSLIPFTQKFAAYARLGIQNASTHDTFYGIVPPGFAGASQKEINGHAGLGLRYDFNPQVAVRAEWERYTINDGFNGRSPVNVYSVNILFPFGHKAAAAPAPAPEPVAPAPAPAPKVEAAPAAPEKLTLSAGSLFDFDKADVKPEGKKSLDKLAHDLGSVNYDAVSVTGHTDRIGSDSYNQKLSVRRAESVKNYLVSDGVPAEKIFATGKGKSDPVTTPGECKGKKVTKALIKCLQPDRRVVVEVSGTRK